MILEYFLLCSQFNLWQVFWQITLVLRVYLSNSSPAPLLSLIWKSMAWSNDIRPIRVHSYIHKWQFHTSNKRNWTAASCFLDCFASPVVVVQLELVFPNLLRATRCSKCCNCGGLRPYIRPRKRKVVSVSNRGQYAETPVSNGWV